MLLLGNHLKILVATTRCGFRAKVYWAIGDIGGMKPRITRVARLVLVLIWKFDIPDGPSLCSHHSLFLFATRTRSVICSLHLQRPSAVGMATWSQRQWRT